MGSQCSWQAWVFENQATSRVSKLFAAQNAYVCAVRFGLNFPSRVAAGQARGKSGKSADLPDLEQALASGQESRAPPIESCDAQNVEQLLYGPDRGSQGGPQAVIHCAGYSYCDHGTTRQFEFWERLASGTLAVAPSGITVTTSDGLRGNPFRGTSL